MLLGLGSEQDLSSFRAQAEDELRFVATQTNATGASARASIDDVSSF